MPLLSDLIQRAADRLFMPWVLLVLMGGGLYLTLRLRVVQVRRFREALRVMLTARPRGADGPLTPFQAFMTALGASIGTGNIAGVATAIISGGPGALFWIWCYGFFATAIKFCEAVLGLRFRVARGDQVQSGPMYYLRDGLKSPALAWLYAAAACLGALTTTPFSQPNSIGVALSHVLPTGAVVLPWLGAVSRASLYVGLAVGVLTWAVIIGGIKVIGRAAEKLAPLKVGLYLAGGLIVLVTYAAALPSVLALVFREAFSLHAAGGTAAGLGVMMAMRYGVARGVRQRGGLRHRGGGLRHRAERSARTAGPARGDGDLHRVLRDLLHQRPDHPRERRGAAVHRGDPRRGRGPHQHGGGGRRLQHGDAHGGWLDRGLLRLPLRLHHPHRLGLLRRAGPRVLVGPGPRGCTAGSTACSSPSAPSPSPPPCGPGVT